MRHVFLNASGAAEEVHEGDGRLPAFLSYVDGGGTMGDAWLERLDVEVQALNMDEGWRETMLSFESLLEEEKALARKKGWDEGLAAGWDKGLAEGLAEGRAEGLAEGRVEAHDKYVDLDRRLALALREAAREDELLDAVLDASVRQRLLEEFGLLA